MITLGFFQTRIIQTNIEEEDQFHVLRITKPKETETHNTKDKILVKIQV